MKRTMEVFGVKKKGFERERGGEDRDKHAMRGKLKSFEKTV